MLKSSFLEIFERDLKKLKEEISLYTDESSLWTLTGEISNTPGNLCLHLTGNLNHFIGAVLGNNGFVRQRDDEFALKNVSRDKMLRDLDKTMDVAAGVLNKMSEEDFLKEFPVDKHGKKVTTDFMLMHLISHFNYHLGQINYHRRILSDSAGLKS